VTENHQKLTDAQRLRLTMIAVAKASIRKSATGADLIDVAEWILNGRRRGTSTPTGLTVSAEPEPALMTDDETRGPWMTIEDVANELGVPVPTLRYWRAQKSSASTVEPGPPSSKIGRRVFYRRADVEAWASAHFDDPDGS
jgi:hypothetical protein